MRIEFTDFDGDTLVIESGGIGMAMLSIHNGETIASVSLDLEEQATLIEVLRILGREGAEER
jgi:hypothetical protein